MRKSNRAAAPWLMAVLPLLLVGCMPAQDASDTKTVRAYNKVTGQYFDVRVPYGSSFGPDGTWSRVEPSQGEVDKAVDDATWKAESSASMDNYLHGNGNTATGGAPGGSSTSFGPNPLDHTTSSGSSYHDAGSPFDTGGSSDGPSWPNQ